CPAIWRFEPAAKILLWLASTATVGSFCLFCENGDLGLALVTFTDPSAAAWAASKPPAITKAAADPSTISTLKGLFTTLSFPAISQDSGTRRSCSRQSSPAAWQLSLPAAGIDRITSPRDGAQRLHHAHLTTVSSAPPARTSARA